MIDRFIEIYDRMERETEVIEKKWNKKIVITFVF